jgi:hypothetical protein
VPPVGAFIRFGHSANKTRGRCGPLIVAGPGRCCRLGGGAFPTGVLEDSRLPWQEKRERESERRREGEREKERQR